MNAKRNKALRTVLFSVLGAVLIALLLSAGAFLFLPKSDPQYVAHRGYSGRYVDNTAASFRAASEMPFYGIETDVRETEDGVFVCNHDETAKYADGGQLTIAASTFTELAEKPLRNTKTDEDAFICTFEDYLRICKSGGKIAVIELKETFNANKIAQILQIVDTAYDRAHISVISFYIEPLLQVRQADPSVEIQYLSDTKDDPNFARCLREDIPVDVRQSILTKKLVREFHNEGLTVNVWTVNKKFDLTVVRIKGVDYVTSNFFCGQ